MEVMAMGLLQETNGGESKFTPGEYKFCAKDDTSAAHCKTLSRAPPAYLATFAPKTVASARFLSIEPVGRRERERGKKTTGIADLPGRRM
jgi:hypothetical protein